MTADAVGSFDDFPAQVLPPKATPAAIREALIDEERVEFERDYRDAVSKAGKTWDLSPVFDVLRNYHRIACITRLNGASSHRRMLAQAEEIARTGKNPDGRSEEQLMALINKRLGR
jgi:hypothetical protein